MTNDERIEIPPPLLDALCNAQHIAVLTGAGVSAESGVPTFRDAQTGLWSKFNPQELATDAPSRTRDSISNMRDGASTREAFARNPKLVWEWSVGCANKLSPRARRARATERGALRVGTIRKAREKIYTHHTKR